MTTISPIAQIGVKRWHLECKDNQHYKFYSVYLTDTSDVVFHWGRIGTKGQAKFQHLPTYDAAETVAMKQVYAKAGKGYKKLADLSFTLPGDQLAQFIRDERFDLLADHARQNNAIDGLQNAATTHYNDFIRQAEQLMARVETEGFLDVLGDFEALTKAWSELDERHSYAKTTLGLTEQMLQAKLVDG